MTGLPIIRNSHAPLGHGCSGLLSHGGLLAA